MGNYQEYLKMMPSPLREIDPDQPKRLHTFGNPFKQDKKVKICQVKSCMLQHAVKDVFINIKPFILLCSLKCLSQGMMIDEADEFVAGPQNKKRGNSSDSNLGATMKRRRSMSPLLRRPQTPPGNTNHVVGGKSPAGVQAQQNLVKPILQYKGKTIPLDLYCMCT